jgi:hypothetical protein
MRLARTTSLLFLLGALACDAETFGADDIQIDPANVAVVGRGAIAGAILTLQAPEFAHLSEEPKSGSIGGVPVAMLPRDPASDTIRLVVPGDIAGGQAAITLRFPTQGEVPLGTIAVAGFAPMRYVAGSTWSVAQVLPYLPGIVTSDLSGTLVVDARTATARQIPTNQQIDGIGSTFVGNSFVIDDWSGWRRATMSLGQVRVDSAWLGWSGAGPTHELAPGVSLQAIKGGYSDLNTGDLSSGYLDGYGYPEHVAYSANGRWSVPDHWRSDSGLLVWDRQLASYFWMPRWRMVRTAFLPNDELVVVGSRDGEPYDYTQPIWLARIDPATRTVLDSVDLGRSVGKYPSLGTTSQGWIVIAWGGVNSMEVSIRDPQTLDEIGRASAPTRPTGEGYACLLVDDPSTRRWYLIAEGQSGTIEIATFLYLD